MAKIVRLTESDLTRIVNELINENIGPMRQIARSTLSSSTGERPLTNKTVMFYSDIQQTKKYGIFRIGPKGAYPNPNKPGFVILNGVSTGGFTEGGSSGSGNLLIDFDCKSSTFKTKGSLGTFYNSKLADHLKKTVCNVSPKTSTPKTDF
jgi:hypothetical protein